MKRKLLYTIIFISIFLMSSASMVTPVQGYEPPDIPAEAKGMTLDDTEVVVYDEDAMEDSLGRGFDIKDIKDGDADIVGARSQMKILDWETDEDLVKYEEDFLYPGGDIEGGYDTIRYTFWFMGNVSQSADVAPVAELIKDISPAALDTGAVLTGLGTAVDTLADASIDTWDVLMGLYADEYDGTILEREIWDLLDPAEEFDPNDPDVTGSDADVPYLLDPRDWRAAETNGRALRDYVLSTSTNIQNSLDNWYGYLYSTLPVSNYTAINATIAAIPSPVLVATLAAISLPYSGGLVIDYPLGMYLLGTYITQSVYYGTLYAFPDKFGLLLMLLEAGQPCCGPTADFIKRAVKEFYINDGPWKIPFIEHGEDFLGPFGAQGADDDISSTPLGTTYMALGGWPVPMGGETVYVYAEVDIEVDDAGTVEIGIEYLDDQLDPRDILRNDADYRAVFGSAFEDDPDELDDWEWVFPKGSDADTVMKDGDNVFYQTHPMEGPIPGYETPVILGVSLASVIALIYVVMRKRKR